MPVSGFSFPFMKCISFIFLFLISFQLHAQDRPIGHWRGHMPYNNAISIATDGVTLYVASTESFYTFNAATQEVTTYSKVEGMSDAIMSAVAYDPVSGFTILAYQNSNVDLFKDGTFYNLPDIKLKAINGDKTIYSIYTDGGLAYLSTGFGIVVIDPVKKEIKETYSFTTNNQTIAVRNFTAAGNYFYAATRGGLYRVIKNAPNLQAFSSWQQIDARVFFNRLASVGSKVFASEGDSIFVWNGTALTEIFHVDETTADILSISDAGNNNLWVSVYYPAKFLGTVYLMNDQYQLIDSFKQDIGKPQNVVQLEGNNTVWIADEFNGLYSAEANKQHYFITPPGPSTFTSFDILPYNGDVWVAHGAIDDKFNYKQNRRGISHFQNNNWTHYNQRNNKTLDTGQATDFIGLSKDPQDGTIYATSFRSGMFIIRPDGSTSLLKAPYFDETPTDAGAYRVGTSAFDSKGNLWIAQSLGGHDLVMKNPADQYFKFSGPGILQIAVYIAIDDADQKWYSVSGRGVVVMNDGSTPENPADDQYRVLSPAEGLPTSNVFSIVKDKEGAMWIGTDDGIGIVNCASAVIGGGCNVDRPIVQFDQFAGYLFQGEKIKTIAVDGANRKWIGTTNGAWLLNAEGDKILERFTAENSPLPSNGIQDIAVDPITGDVYFGTDLGLVSFRYTATDGGEVNENVTVFPNPVLHDYDGPIAIKGLVGNADVRITDVSGQLVFRTKALGGQAVWNGKDYNERRPQSGVYLIFITNADGSQTHVGKLVFQE